MRRIVTPLLIFLLAACGGGGAVADPAPSAGVDPWAARQLPWMYRELAAGFGLYDPVAHAWRTELVQALYGTAP